MRGTPRRGRPSPPSGGGGQKTVFRKRPFPADRQDAPTAGPFGNPRRRSAEILPPTRRPSSAPASLCQPAGLQRLRSSGCPPRLFSPPQPADSRRVILTFFPSRASTRFPVPSPLFPAPIPAQLSPHASRPPSEDPVHVHQPFLCRRPLSRHASQPFLPFSPCTRSSSPQAFSAAPRHLFFVFKLTLVFNFTISCLSDRHVPRQAPDSRPRRGLFWKEKLKKNFIFIRRTPCHR